MCLFIQVKHQEPPLSLHSSLLWREFFFDTASKNSDLHKMAKNPVCLQLPWEEKPEALEKWAQVRHLAYITDHEECYCNGERQKVKCGNILCCIDCRVRQVFRGLMPS